MQVLSRIVIVWGVVFFYPDATATSPFYSSMLIAWSVTEIVRYGYFAQTLRGADPGILTWLRYNMFYVLYPMGISSEVALVWKASNVASTEVRWALWALIGIYVPGRSTY